MMLGLAGVSLAVAQSPYRVDGEAAQAAQTASKG